MTIAINTFGEVFSDPFFSPFEDPVSPPVTCFNTLYDGVNDYFTSSEAAFKINGDFTSALEFNLNDFASGASYFFGNQAGARGFLIQPKTDGSVSSLINGVLASVTTTSAPGLLSIGTWFKLLLVSAINDTPKMYLNDVLVATGAVLVPGMSAPPTDFHIANIRGVLSAVLDGYMRNITICAGATSTPTAWKPEDPTSLIGCAQVFYSAKGNDENTQSLVFTEFGDPITGPCV